MKKEFHVEYRYLATGMEGIPDIKSFGTVMAENPEDAKNIVIEREYPRTIAHGNNEKAKERDFVRGCLSVKEIVSINNWISIKDQPLPKDKTKIIRWHYLMKCSVSVYYCPKNATDPKKTCVWTTSTYSNTYPEAAFAPYWKPECEAPPEL